MNSTSHRSRNVVRALFCLCLYAASAVSASAQAADAWPQVSPMLSAQAATGAGSRFVQFSAAAPTAKQNCIKACRTRYRDCRRLKQMSLSECRGVYQDCSNYSCAGLGPG